jgi:hypothetical protein
VREQSSKGGRMKTQALLIGVIVVMGGVIVFLMVLLLQPPPPYQPITFEYLMNLTRDLRADLKTVNLTYIVNLSLQDKDVIGQMNFYKDDETTSFELSDELKEYEGCGLLLSPLSQVNFIQTNTRQEYSGRLFNLVRQELCWSTITAPSGTQYDKIINGDYLFITCFDNTTGYPSVVYNSEILGEQVITSYMVLTNRSYENK